MGDMPLKNTIFYIVKLQTPGNAATVLDPLGEFSKALRTIAILRLGYNPREGHVNFAQYPGSLMLKTKKNSFSETRSGVQQLYDLRGLDNEDFGQKCHFISWFLSPNADIK